MIITETSPAAEGKRSFCMWSIPVRSEMDFDESDHGWVRCGEQRIARPPEECTRRVMDGAAQHTCGLPGCTRRDNGDTHGLYLSRTPAGQADPGTLYSGNRRAGVDDLARPLYRAYDPAPDCPKPGSPGSGRFGSLGVLPGALARDLRRKGRRARLA